MPIKHHQQKRPFQSRVEHSQWIDRIKSSVMPRPANAVRACPSSRAAPFLASVDSMVESRFNVYEVPKKNCVTKHSPFASFLEVHIPLSSDLVVRTAVSDLGSWSTMRLSKFYELVDALTGDVVYRYSAGLPIAWVTGGHYSSRKLAPTDITTDVVIRCYLTNVGRSSVEIRTDAFQNDRLVNFCHTIMVALDPTSMRPLLSSSAAGDTSVLLPPLEIDKEDRTGQEERAALAEWHDRIRKERAQSTMYLRTAISTPPTPSEVQGIHELHQRAVRMREGPQPRPPKPRTIAEYTFRSCFVIFPEDRNLHGKLFGGYVMSEAYNLALYAVKFFARSGRHDTHSVVPLGIDEAVFHQPVSIGDLVTFTARVVHATEYTCRVFVTVQVLDPTDAKRLPQRSNRLGFVFCSQTPRECKADGCSFILPNTYSEVLMQVEASRRHKVEGPSENEARAILEEARTNQELSTHL